MSSSVMSLKNILNPVRNTEVASEYNQSFSAHPVASRQLPDARTFARLDAPAQDPAAIGDGQFSQYSPTDSYFVPNLLLQPVPDYPERRSMSYQQLNSRLGEVNRRLGDSIFRDRPRMPKDIELAREMWLEERRELKEKLKDIIRSGRLSGTADPHHESVSAPASSVSMPKDANKAQLKDVTNIRKAPKRTVQQPQAKRKASEMSDPVTATQKKQKTSNSKAIPKSDTTRPSKSNNLSKSTMTTSSASGNLAKIQPLEYTMPRSEDHPDFANDGLYKDYEVDGSIYRMPVVRPDFVNTNLYHDNKYLVIHYLENGESRAAVNPRLRQSPFKPINWEQEKSAFGKWQNQFFLRHTGEKKRKAVTPFLPQEREWLADMFAAAVALDNKITIPEMHRLFSLRFEGSKWQSVGSDGTVTVSKRPVRTFEAINSEIYRNPAVKLARGCKVESEKVEAQRKLDADEESRMEWSEFQIGYRMLELNAAAQKLLRDGM